MFVSVPAPEGYFSDLPCTTAGEKHSKGDATGNLEVPFNFGAKLNHFMPAGSSEQVNSVLTTTCRRFGEGSQQGNLLKISPERLHVCFA